MNFLFMIYILIIFMVSFTRLCSQDAPSPDMVSYRPATVAGTFYPNDPDELKLWVKRYLDNGEASDKSQNIFGLVVPHAGYVYSGWIAGKAYKKVQGRKYDAVIIIAPSHTQAFDGSSVFDGDAYNTPLGEAMVDKELAKEISGVNDLVKISRKGHGWKGDRTEHSLEVQIPFIQTVLPKSKIVPIVMGTQDFESVDALMKAIVFSVKKLNKNVLIVASSDLSHYHDETTAKSMDGCLIKAFDKYDYFRIALNTFSRKWEACGGAPIVVAMMAAEQLGANKANTVLYSNSANSPYIKGDSQRVVGYFSGLIYKDEITNDLLPLITNENRHKLLEVAKATIINTAKEEEEIINIGVPAGELSEEYAVFVTIHKHGQLRGCMGHTIADNNLISAVEESAKLACSRDPRFSPVQEDELDELDYEITVLSRMKRILNIEEIEPGRDGVLLRLRYNSGLFLPQVATEQNWDRLTLLEQLGRKANLPKDSYKDSKAELYIFRGMVIK
ncbi:MAG: AmmeMemoRadiSam system protein B [bacterium]